MEEKSALQTCTRADLVRSDEHALFYLRRTRSLLCCTREFGPHMDASRPTRRCMVVPYRLRVQGPVGVSIMMPVVCSGTTPVETRRATC